MHNVPDEYLAFLLTISVVVQEAFEDGAIIVQQGDPGDCMFVVQSGEVIASHRATGDVGSGTEVLFASLPEAQTLQRKHRLKLACVFSGILNIS